MKNKERNKPTKKRILMYYLILAACLLVIAAVTVGVVFGFKSNEPLGPTLDTEVTPPDKNPENPVISDENKIVSPVKGVNVSQSFCFAWHETTKCWRVHQGMDFKCDAGTEVVATEKGKITQITRNDKLYSGSVTIQHANGIKTVYKFIDPNEDLKEGDDVKSGDVIGTVAVAYGNENADGEHLHFEVYHNKDMQDPEEYLNVNDK